MTYSIIIPIYNQELYLRECLNSIKDQTFTDFECIMVDDGSTDSSAKICGEYTAIDQRFILIKQQNHGVSSARNAALKVASGDYICFCDSDDFYNKDFLQSNIAYMSDGQADMCICGYHRLNPDGFSVCLPESKSELVSNKVFDLVLFDKACNGYLWNKIFKRDIIIKHCLQLDESIFIMEDTLFTMEYLTHCNIVRFNPKNLYAYRIHPNSVIHQHCKITVKNVSSLWSMIMIFDILRSNGLERSVIKKLTGIILMTMLGMLRGMLFNKSISRSVWCKTLRMIFIFVINYTFFLIK